MPCHAEAGRVRKSPAAIPSWAMIQLSNIFRYYNTKTGYTPNMLQACAPGFWSLGYVCSFASSACAIGENSKLTKWPQKVSKEEVVLSVNLDFSAKLLKAAKHMTTCLQKRLCQERHIFGSSWSCSWSLTEVASVSGLAVCFCRKKLSEILTTFDYNGDSMSSRFSENLIWWYSDSLCQRCAVPLFGFNIWCPLLHSACPWDCRRQQRKKFDKQLCCACFSFSDFRINLSKCAIANSIPTRFLWLWFELGAFGPLAAFFGKLLQTELLLRHGAAI